MARADTHYHRIETADELASEKKDDVMYYLTRLEGQLERFDFLLNKQHSSCSYGEAKDLNVVLTSAKAFAQSLRNAIESRPDAS